MNWEDWVMPDGWTISALTDITDVIMGQSPPGNTYNTEGFGLPFFQGKSEFGDDHPTVRKWCTAPTRIAEEGDILMSVRAPVGPTNVADQQCAVGRGLAIIRPRPGVPTSLVRYGIKLQEDEIASWGTGTTFTAINKDHFQRIHIPLPPLGFRDQLAQVLEQAVALQRSASTHLTNARPIIERFRQAVLLAAFSGRLTMDWRETSGKTEHVLAFVEIARQRRMAQGGRKFRESELNFHADFSDLPAQWQAVPLGLLLEDLQYGTSKRSEYGIDGIPVLRIPNVSSGHLSLADLKFTKLDKREAKSLALVPSDLLMIRSNGSPQLLGRTVLVTEESSGMAYAGYLIRLRVDTSVVNPEYLTLALAAPQMRTQIEMPVRSTSGVHNINSEEVRGLVIPLPSLQEQDEIVRRVKQLLNVAETVNQRLQIAERDIERSTQAILAKFFRGELSATASEKQNAQLVM